MGLGAENQEGADPPASCVPELQQALPDQQAGNGVPSKGISHLNAWYGSCCHQ